METFDIQLTDGEKTWWECGFQTTHVSLLKSTVGGNDKSYAPPRGKKLTPRQYATALIKRTNYDDRIWRGDKAKVLALVSVGTKPQDPDSDCEDSTIL